MIREKFYLDELEMLQQAKNEKSDAELFCFILFTKRNSEVVKFLKDEEYREELDEISNEFLNIFAIAPFDNLENTFLNNNFSPQRIGFLTISPVEKHINYRLLNKFGLNDVDDLPLLYFVEKESEDGYGFKIKANTKEEVHKVIKEVIQTCISLQKKKKLNIRELDKNFAKQENYNFIKRSFTLFKKIHNLLNE